MQFSVGYRPLHYRDETFAEIVREYRGHIGEVYFAWPGEASGRSPLLEDEIPLITRDLERIGALGVRLNLLFNASCYGEYALSRELEHHVLSLVGTLMDRFGIDAVTTMSPLVARSVKRRFNTVDVRASVNMRLGTVRALEYVGEYFDSYNVQREYNRDPGRIRQLLRWAESEGKKLHLLANSGCMNFCSFQTFHDNVVSHQRGIAALETGTRIGTLCRNWYGVPANRVGFLQGSWIRPEDLAEHFRMFGCNYKLATRMHDNPRLVLDAYTRRKHYGNLVDLMEPGFADLFYPQIIDNSRFPSDWFDTTMSCDKRCDACSYCRDVLGEVLIDLGGAAAPSRRSPRAKQSNA